MSPRLLGTFVVSAGLAVTVTLGARQAGTWTQIAYLKASNPGMFDHFGEGGALDGHIGNSVAISGDGNTIAVGAQHESSGARGINGNQHDESAYNAGAVYVYVRSGATWAQQAYVKASNTGRRAAEGGLVGDGDQFGLSVALSGDGNTMAVGAPTEDSAATGINGDPSDNSVPYAGAVYVFVRDDAGELYEARSTVPLWISGTSSSKRRLRKPLCVRLTNSAGPRGVRRTSRT